MIEYFAIFTISILIGFAVGYGLGNWEAESAYRQGLKESEYRANPQLLQQLLNLQNAFKKEQSKKEKVFIEKLNKIHAEIIINNNSPLPKETK